MRLENLIHLLHGTLHTSPTISSFTSFGYKLEDIKRGTLFFAVKKEDIPQAIQKGAYGIVYEGKVEISDKEIAWIEVDNLLEAVVKLVRFFFIQNGVKIFELPLVTFSLAKALFSHTSEIFFLKRELFEVLASLEEIRYLFTPLKLSTLLHLEKIEVEEAPLKLISQTLFEVSFIFEEEFYERFKLSPLFFPELKQLFFISKTYNFHLEPHKIYLFNHFKPHFVNSRLEVVEFGKSQKVVITEEECKLLSREKRFLQTYAKWAKKLYLTTSCQTDGFKKVVVEELKEVLYNSSFNFALVESSKPFLKKREPKTKTLF